MFYIGLPGFFFFVNLPLLFMYITRKKDEAFSDCKDQLHAWVFSKNNYNAYTLSSTYCVSSNILSSWHALFYLIIIVTNETGTFIYLHFVWVQKVDSESVIASLRSRISGGRAQIRIQFVTCLRLWPYAFFLNKWEDFLKVTWRSKQFQQAKSHVSWSRGREFINIQHSAALFVVVQ